MSRIPIAVLRWDVGLRACCGVGGGSVSYFYTRLEEKSSTHASFGRMLVLPNHSQQVVG